MSNIELYNYMPLKYFFSLLEKGLYFKFSHLYEDKLEGYIPHDKFSTIRHEVEKTANDLNVEMTPCLSKAVENKFIEISKNQQSETLVNCWHHNIGFSIKMWDEYAGGGVYIKTSDFQLLSSIPKNLLPLFHQSSLPGGILHKIKYIESHDDIPDSDAKTAILNDDAHGIKRKLYSRETEYRLIIKEVLLGILTDIRLTRHTEVRGIDDLKIETSSDDISVNKIGDEFEGLYIKIDAPKLIGEIGIVGESNLESIFKKVSQMGFSINLRIYSDDLKTSRLINSAKLT